MASDEVYLGGFSSADISKGIIAGYGIYATDRRIIGVKSIGGALVGALIGGAIVGAVGGGRVVGASVAKKLAEDKSAKMIQELDKKKDFEISKDQIAQIEIKNRGFVTNGHLVITPRSGDVIRIKIHHNRAFRMTRDLMQSFSPELTKVIE